MKKYIYILTFLFSIFVIYLFIQINKQKDLQAENIHNCNNDDIVNLRHGNLSLVFYNDYKKLVQKKIIVEIVRKGKLVQKLEYFQKNNDNQIEIKNELILQTTDSLKITFINSESIYIHGFKNEVEYANQKIYLGCFLKYFKINNGKEMPVRDGSRITVL
ncbi:hypothetical protein Q1W71_02310 [Flavobacterium pectinovorum]|uniref:hypothetical protein n=1 Tax=Flavobacterium pectinovorum TaxID=29533 RepID=UPI00265E8C8F|nr:hypothetical protein [Flavobacterium pectinovorum]WKL48621.1 hypothetical protein Q1W71_02310 [Flavobacterium pectinovorum]